MEITGKFTIDCERCGKSYDFLKEDVKFTPEEREGEDKWSVWELEYNCLRCSNPISIRYEICFSPEGEFKDKKVTVTGAKVVNDSFEFSR